MEQNIQFTSDYSLQGFWENGFHRQKTYGGQIDDVCPHDNSSSAAQWHKAELITLLIYWTKR